MAFKINIEKNIPHGSGLGGGSTNAASLLNYFASKKRFNIKRKEKIKIMDDFIKACKPKTIEVVGDFNPRGGIKTTINSKK